MARQRFIHPEIWEDPEIGKMQPTERLFFIGCFSNADDEGRLLGNPAFLRSAIFKYDDFSADQVREMRDRVIDACKNLVLYVIDDVEYLAFLKWSAYQKPKYPKQSKLPPPPAAGPELPPAAGPPINKAETGEGFPPNSGKPSPPMEKELPPGLGREGTGKDGGGTDESTPPVPSPTGELETRPRADAIAELTAFITNKFIPGASPFQVESILKWTEEGMEPSAVMWALQRALAENVRKPSYVGGILKNLAMAGITTGEAAAAAERLHRRQKAGGEPAKADQVERTRAYLASLEQTERTPPERARGKLESIRQILARSGVRPEVNTGEERTG